MDYQDENDLIDDRGFNNSSFLEYMVAQFLIANNVSYAREVMPFKNTSHRTDFLIETIEGERIFVEVWGYLKNDTGAIGKAYNKTRKLKERLYKESNHYLISLEREYLYGVPYKEVELYLFNKFSCLESLSIKRVSPYQLISPTLLTDDEILSAFMLFSKEPKTLPTQDVIIERGLNLYLREIRRRYSNGYYEFAEKMGKELTTVKYQWSEELLYVHLKEIVEKYKLPVNKKNMIKYKLHGMLNYTIKLYGKGGYTPVRLHFYLKYLKEGGNIHPEDVKFINSIAKRQESSPRYDMNDIMMAREIIDLVPQQSKEVI